MTEMREIEDRARTAIVEGDASPLEECSYDLETIQLMSDEFRDDVLQMIFRVLESPEFLALTGSWRFLMVLQIERDKLRADQKALLLDALEKAYPQFADPQSLFFVSEFVGITYGDADGLLFFEKMAARDETARAMAAHGLGHVARLAAPRVREVALKQLAVLANDESSNVKAEADLSPALSPQAGRGRRSSLVLRIRSDAGRAGFRWLLRMRKLGRTP